MLGIKAEHLPQPEFGPATMKIFDILYGSLFRTKSGFSEPSLRLYLKDQKRAVPGPLRLMVFRNCLGTTRSVTMLDLSSGAVVQSKSDAQRAA